jgi:hypothetical protein
MRALVERHVEVFALLADARDCAVGGGFLEFGAGGADFAVDDCVFGCGDGDDCAVSGVFAQVVDYAGDFADLVGRWSVGWLVFGWFGEGGWWTDFGHFVRERLLVLLFLGCLSDGKGANFVGDARC